MESMTGDEIVISGIAGRFPNSDNINELQKNLFNKIDCISDCKNRWDFGMNLIKHYKFIFICKKISFFEMYCNK